MGCIQKSSKALHLWTVEDTCWSNCQRKPTERQSHLPFSLSRQEPKTAFKPKLRNDPVDKVMPFPCLSKKWTFSVSTVDENVIFLLQFQFHSWLASAETENSNKIAEAFNTMTDRWGKGLEQLCFSDYVNKTWRVLFQGTDPVSITI